jgi:hypothetical protein
VLTATVADDEQLVDAQLARTSIADLAADVERRERARNATLS